MKLPKLFAVLASLVLMFASVEAAQAGESLVRIRFLDSATGCAIQPDSVEANPRARGQSPKRWERGQLPRVGRATLALEPGRHTVSAVSAKHQPMTGEVVVSPENAYALDFYLDPVELPEELRPETTLALQREDATLIQGFVVDDEAGEPIANALVLSFPSRVEAQTDARGFFRVFVPVQDKAEATEAPANLVFVKPGYEVLERQHLELWARGDWTYKIRLKRGKGKAIVDERSERRRLPQHGGTESQGMPELFAKVADSTATTLATDPGIEPPPVAATVASNATIRVPRNIRVVLADNVTIEYVSMDYYVKHVLPAEWISSWASYTGGSNSLNAGAVAVRCYAIAKLNTVSTTSTHDICATTSCQVYGTATSTAANTAADYTANFVVVTGSGVIPSTEYSAENNSLGYSCGDGYTQPTGGCIYDPVCTGEARYGHGRGMCQWGTARWATARKMAGRSSGDATPNGYPRQDWKWIVNHYYPGNILVRGAPLILGDDVKVIGATQTIRLCDGGNITNGVNCASVTTKAVGSAGLIIDGPVRVTVDGKGFTWYKVQWRDAQIGWTPENWLERSLATPATPSVLTATAVATNQINLTWTDNSIEEFGFKIERAPTASGTWTQIDTVMANTNAYADTNGLSTGTTYHYRVRAFNSANSSYSNITNATTLSAAYPIITLQPWSQTKGLGQTVTFLATATGNNPLGYQWRKDGVNLGHGARISGATATNLNITSLQSTDAGSYTLVVTNSSGAATTSVAALTVSGVIVWQDDFDTNTAANWLTNKTSTDTRVTFNHDYSTMGIAPAPHTVGGTTRAVKFEANLTAGVAAAINLSPVGKAFGSDFKLRFDMWLNANGPFPLGGTGSTEYITAGVGTTGTRVQWTGSGTTADGVWFAANGEGQAGDTSTTSDFNAYTATTLQTVATAVYAAGTASNARGNSNAYYSVKFPGGQTAPAYQQTTHAQQTGALAVGTAGLLWRDVLINKQGNVVEWFIDGLKIAAITNAALAGSNICIGYWDPFTSVSDNSALSFGLVDNVRVEIAAQSPSITTPPLDQFVAAGSNATFSVLATGTAPLGYQWRRAGTNLPAATQSTFTRFTAQTADEGEYRVVVTNLAGAITSAPAMLVVNNPPQLTPVTARLIHAGVTLALTNSASDTDVPANTLTFTLDPGAPPAATLQSASGILAWPTTDADAGTTNSFTVRVTDDGIPPLSDAKTFTVGVLARPGIGSISASGGNVTLNWSAIPAARYRVQCKTNLDDAAWINLTPDITATGGSATFSDTPGAGQRFYRVLVLTP